MFRHGTRYTALLVLLQLAGGVSYGQRKNLGPTVSTQWNEIIPIISADGKTLYFDRKRYPLNTGGEGDFDDIWYSQSKGDNVWGEAQNLKALNTRTPNAIFSILPDNNTALYWGALDSAGKLAFSLVHRTEDGWSQPNLLRIRNFYNLADGVTASLAADGKTLLMALRRSDSPGALNLYVSFLDDEEANTWTEPRSLGPIINTFHGESTPLIGADGETLFFSSARPGGYGGTDIYVARRLDSTWMNWTEPENLGPEFNIPGENFLSSITASGEYAFLAGSVENPGKNLDIFRLKLPEKFRSRPVVLVKGHVWHETSAGSVDSTHPLAARIVYERLRDGKRLGSARTDPRTGAYQIALPGHEIYGMRVESSGHLPVSDHVDLSSLTSYREVTHDYALPVIAVGSTVKLNNIFFDFAKNELNPESFAELNRRAEILQQNGTMEVVIEGHTDDVGSNDMNDALSLARATAVRSYLIEHAIDPTRMGTRGFGKRKPVAPNDTEEGRSKNRRVVVRVVKK
jgi:OOP family OmpA-OmpF porin